MQRSRQKIIDDNEDSLSIELSEEEPKHEDDYFERLKIQRASIEIE